MLMPKAAVDENHFLNAAEDQIGTSRQVFRMEPISAAESPADFANDHLRLRIAPGLAYSFRLAVCFK